MNHPDFPFPVKEEYMRRALSIATQGLGYASPNPTVGCVVVYDNLIIGEGFHHQCGQAHAEVNAIDSVLRPNAVTAQLMRETGKTAAEILQESTLYVTLEPCSHYGKTPPCAKKIIDNHIPRVVVCCPDPNPRVNGGGVAMLREAGVKVVERFLMEEGRVVARRFFTNIEKSRPYIILKWAQTADGYISRSRDESFAVTGKEIQVLNHRFRTEEDAIMVGTNTLLVDNPRLNARLYFGKQPCRVSLDLHGRVLEYLHGHCLSGSSAYFHNTGESLHFFDGTQPSLLFVSEEKEKDYAPWKDKVRLIPVPSKLSCEELLPRLMEFLHSEKIGSVIIEGGSCLLDSFLRLELWDEARVFVSPKLIGEGYEAPVMRKILPLEEMQVGCDKVRIYYGNHAFLQGKRL